MIEYTIDNAIERCKDRANISALHHMMRTSQEWELTAVWLERLRDASSTIQVADYKHEPYYPGDNVFDMRDKEHTSTIEQVCGILDGLSEGGTPDS